ncbi:hypothetical protein MIR68_008973 [Amoeboaphelidium protococcarum]|nr:hypothetical protein MIR68_008973 [Amoeboaphelidium protococcarum]
MSSGSVYRQQDDLLQLKQLVTEALEKKGVLSRVKAELRSGISDIVLAGGERKGNDRVQIRGKQQQNDQSELSSQNSKLEQMKASREGRLVLDMISEFLLCFDLKHSNGVLAAEVGSSETFDPELRHVIQTEIGLNPLDEIQEPLLFSLLREYEQKTKQRAGGSVGGSRRESYDALNQQQ